MGYELGIAFVLIFVVIFHKELFNAIVNFKGMQCSDMYDVGYRNSPMHRRIEKEAHEAKLRARKKYKEMTGRDIVAND